MAAIRWNVFYLSAVVAALGLSLSGSELAEASPESPALRVAKAPKGKKRRKKRDKKRDEKRDEESAPKDDSAPDDSSAEPKPWSQGVSAEDRARAEKLLAEGNSLFLQEKYVQALEKYQEALEVWDHPTIRFNLARTLVYLGRTVEAYANVEESLRFGPEPLEENIYQEARSYRELLSRQIGELSVSCSQDGVEISLNGAPLLSCPGKVERRIMPGRAQVLAEKEGFIAQTREVFISPGKRESVEIELVATAEAITYERRWAVWKPWAVVGAGAIVGAGGGLLLWKSKRDFDAYDRELANRCANGCEPGEISGSLRNLERRAGIENVVAIGSLIAGGATLVTGLVLVFVNQPEKVEAAPVLTPSISSDGVGVEARITF